MRYSILVMSSGVPVLNTLSTSIAKNKLLLGDRIANKESFPGERVVRLPRKMVQTERQKLNSQIICLRRTYESLGLDQI